MAEIPVSPKKKNKAGAAARPRQPTKRETEAGRGMEQRVSQMKSSVQHGAGRARRPRRYWPRCPTRPEASSPLAEEELERRR